MGKGQQTMVSGVWFHRKEITNTMKLTSRDERLLQIQPIFQKRSKEKISLKQPDENIQFSIYFLN